MEENSSFKIVSAWHKGEQLEDGIRIGKELLFKNCRSYSGYFKKGIVRESWFIDNYQFLIIESGREGFTAVLLGRYSLLSLLIAEEAVRNLNSFDILIPRVGISLKIVVLEEKELLGMFLCNLGNVLNTKKESKDLQERLVCAINSFADIRDIIMKDFLKI